MMGKFEILFGIVIFGVYKGVVDVKFKVKCN